MEDDVQDMASNHPVDMLIMLAAKVEALEATVAELVEARVA